MKVGDRVNDEEGFGWVIEKYLVSFDWHTASFHYRIIWDGDMTYFTYSELAVELHKIRTVNSEKKPPAG